MSIWFKNYSLDDLNKSNANTLVTHVDIQLSEITENSLIATMPVDHRTKQPFGLLHGGASCVLAETLGSIAGNLCIDYEKYYAVGQSITASHLKSATKGLVKGVATAEHLGGRSQVWRIEIFNEDQQKVCVSSLTMAVLEKAN